MRYVSGVYLRVGLVICLALGILLAGAGTASAAKSKKGDLVVLDTERWIDTLKGTVKNFNKASARDVTVVVKFLDRRKKVLGTQRVSVGDLRSGDQSSFSLAIAEKNRAATHYECTVYAIWH